MTFNEYQEAASKTAVFPKEVSLAYLSLKLNGEAGEIAELVGKKLRGDPDKQDIKDRLIKELGDVMWYVAMLAKEFEVPLNNIAIENLDKLAGRQERGTLKGSGDYR